MGECKILQFRRAFNEREMYNPRMQASIQEVKSDWDLQERLNRIYTSLDRLNKLMDSLKIMKEVKDA